MKIITTFIKIHWKKILIGLILLILTWGLYGLYKLIRSK